MIENIFGCKNSDDLELHYFCNYSLFAGIVQSSLPCELWIKSEKEQNKKIKQQSAKKIVCFSYVRISQNVISQHASIVDKLKYHSQAVQPPGTPILPLSVSIHVAAALLFFIAAAAPFLILVWHIV